MKKTILILVAVMYTAMVSAATWSFAGGTMYFDNSLTKWNKAKMMLIIGKGTSGDGSWSSVYEMSLTAEADVWAANLPTSGWGDATYMAVINSDSKWDDGKWGTNNIKNASHYSAAYTGGIQSEASKGYVFTPQSAANGCTMTMTIKDGGGVPNKWHLRGTFNNWDLSTELKGSGEELSATLALEAGKEYEFKVFYGSDWYGNDGLMTQYHHTGWVFSTSQGANCRLATNIKGNYTFTLNTSTKAVSVTYPTNPKQAKGYDTAVPENNPDVMIQAFYWAHEGSSATPYTAYGDVNWSSLIAESGTLAQYFNLVWLAPSQETADYTGYLPMNYSNQGIAVDETGHHGHSPWGTASELRTLIDNLHNGGAKVVADIVLNHTSAGHVDEYTGSDKNWCTWTENDFGRYGKFTPTWEWLTQEDEMFATDTYAGRIDRTKTGDCGNHDVSVLTPDEKAFPYGGLSEWPYEEYNSLYSRDLAHGNKKVREMAYAYLTWMRDSMGYDGFRWDFMKGFNGIHLYEYTRVTAPYFSVAEVFDGRDGILPGFLMDANYSTYTFDFPGKFHYYNDAIAPYKLSKLKGDNAPLISGANKQYAVTFIDNHDSFREGSNMYGTPNTIDDRQAILALAHLFSMPGVPCVLYPYWHNYTAQCKAFIKARKSAGVHSMSVVQNDWSGNDTEGNNYYTALIKGEKGYVFLKLGYDSYPQQAPSVASPDGKTWKCAWADQNNAGVWYTGDDWEPKEVPTEVTSEGVKELTSEQVTKFMRNGVLYIERDGKTYDVLGRDIDY